MSPALVAVLGKPAVLVAVWLVNLGTLLAETSTDTGTGLALLLTAVATLISTLVTGAAGVVKLLEILERRRAGAVTLTAAQAAEYERLKAARG